MHIITMTKHGANASSESVPAPSARDGAPEIEAIMTTRQTLVDAIRQSLEECYRDPYVYGPAPPETAVSRIVVGVLTLLPSLPRLPSPSSFLPSGNEDTGQPS